MPGVGGESLSWNLDPVVRAELVARPDASPAVVLAAAGDPDPQVRRAAARAAARRIDSDPSLSSALGSAEDPVVAGLALTFCRSGDEVSAHDLAIHASLASSRSTVEALAALRSATWSPESMVSGSTNDNAVHQLRCVLRAGVALVIRDDCDDATAVAAFEPMRRAANDSMWLDGGGSAGWDTTADQRARVLKPLIDRMNAGWRLERIFDGLIDAQIRKALDPARPRGPQPAR